MALWINFYRFGESCLPLHYLPSPEWLAEFRDDIGGWLSADTIKAAVDAGIAIRPPSALFNYVGFIDPSGGARDSYTAAIAYQDGELAVLDCLTEIKPPFDPMATAQMATVLKSYRVGTAQGDRYGRAVGCRSVPDQWHQLLPFKARPQRTLS